MSLAQPHLHRFVSLTAQPIQSPQLSLTRLHTLREAAVFYYSAPFLATPQALVGQLSRPNPLGCETEKLTHRILTREHFVAALPARTYAMQSAFIDQLH